MGIDLLTREHICFGLAIGQGCDSCKAKYPHLLAKTPEEIERGKRGLEAAITAYTDDINGERPRTSAELNDFAYRRTGPNGVSVVQHGPDSPAIIEVQDSRQVVAATSNASAEPKTWWATLDKWRRRIF